jgi:hypothetical protein
MAKKDDSDKPKRKRRKGQSVGDAVKEALAKTRQKSRAVLDKIRTEHRQGVMLGTAAAELASAATGIGLGALIHAVEWTREGPRMQKDNPNVMVSAEGALDPSLYASGLGALAAFLGAYMGGPVLAGVGAGIGSGASAVYLARVTDRALTRASVRRMDAAKVSVDDTAGEGTEGTASLGAQRRQLSKRDLLRRIARRAAQRPALPRGRRVGALVDHEPLGALVDHEPLGALVDHEPLGAGSWSTSDVNNFDF